MYETRYLKRARDIILTNQIDGVLLSMGRHSEILCLLGTVEYSSFVYEYSYAENKNDSRSS